MLSTIKSLRFLDHKGSEKDYKNETQKKVTIGLILITFLIGGGALKLHSIINYPAPAQEKLRETTIIKEFPEGSFPENVAIDAEGRLFVTLLSIDGNPKKSKI